MPNTQKNRSVSAGMTRRPGRQGKMQNGVWQKDGRWYTSHTPQAFATRSAARNWLKLQRVKARKGRYADLSVEDHAQIVRDLEGRI